MARPAAILFSVNAVLRKYGAFFKHAAFSQGAAFWQLSRGVSLAGVLPGPQGRA